MLCPNFLMPIKLAVSLLVMKESATKTRNTRIALVSLRLYVIVTLNFKQWTWISEHRNSIRLKQWQSFINRCSKIQNRKHWWW